MIQLPENLAPEIRKALSSALDEESVDTAFPAFAQGSRDVFGADDAILCLRFGELSSTDDLIHVGGKFCQPDSVLAEKIASQWRASELDLQIRRDLQNRYSAVSYSAFSWPYTTLRVLSPEQEVLFGLPHGYAILLPIHSKMTLRLSSQEQFSGYLVLLFEEFPQLSDVLLSFLISLPQLLSELAAMLANERQVRGVSDLQNYIDEVFHYLSMTGEFAGVVREGKQRVAKAMEPEVVRAQQELMHSTKVVRLLTNDPSLIELRQPAKARLDLILEHVHSVFVAKCLRDGVVLEACFPRDNIDVCLDVNLFCVALGIIIDSARSSSAEGDKINLVGEVSLGREIVISVNAPGPSCDVFGDDLFSGSLALAKAIFELHKGYVELDTTAEASSIRISLPWSIVDSTADQTAGFV